MTSPQRARAEGEPSFDAASASLEDLLDHVAGIAERQEQIAIGDVVRTIGTRSYSPFLLLAGLIMVAPIVGDIPGVPVLMGLVVIILAAQILLHRHRIWVPRWLSKPSVQSRRVIKVVGWLRRPARFLDRWTRPRLEWAVRHLFLHLIAILSIVISAATPLMELVPFSANLAGIAISGFALALFTRDGLVALVAIAFSAAIGFVLYRFF